MIAPSFMLRAWLDPEDVGLLPVPIDVGRKRGVLVREIARSVIPLAREVVGEIQDPAGRVREIGLGGVRDEAIEENNVARLGRYGLQLEPLLLERHPLLADQPL